MTRRRKLIIFLTAFAIVANAPLALVYFNQQAIYAMLEQTHAYPVTTAAAELAQATGEAEETDDHRGTPVLFPVFYQLVQGHNGMAVSAPHGYGPVSFKNKEDCLKAIELRQNQANYYCLRYESAKTIDYTFPDKL